MPGNYALVPGPSSAPLLPSIYEKASPIKNLSGRSETVVFLRAEDAIGHDEALEKPAAVDPRKAELVKLRYFVGMSFEEASSALGIAAPTAKQWWAYARAWLTVEIRGSSPR